LDVKNSRTSKISFAINSWITGRLELLDLNLLAPALVATTSHLARAEHIDVSVLVFLAIAAGLPRLVELWRESRRLARRALISLAAVASGVAGSMQLLIITT